ncbi:MAG TPA: Lpg1974 family pore-forming outer membrane protein [Planctomycetaceae bacterium]|nr:Lpg1974 family pore-forming outer membrane protein [Planctomycetaceae bacterium]
MKQLRHIYAACVLGLAMMAGLNTAQAQGPSPSDGTAPYPTPDFAGPPSSGSSGTLMADPSPNIDRPFDYASPRGDDTFLRGDMDGYPRSPAGFFAGADFLLIRPHFSEATAFARASLGPTGFAATGQNLRFDYDPSFRVFTGYNFGDGGSQVRFTYTRLTGDSEENAGTPGPGQFIADPFGNIVGTAIVLDPNSALFGHPIFGGASIHTEAQVALNIYDLDLITPWAFDDARWVFKSSAGVRIADVRQSYQSTVFDGSGAFFSGGDFAVHFIGAGPRVGFESRRYFGDRSRFSLFANAHGSLIVGQYDARFSQTTTVPAFHASQATSETRTVPVAEAELGAAFRATERLTFTAGWLFQAWFDLGTSGGKFGGFYVIQQNANIMAFEGLFIRGALTF